MAIMVIGKVDLCGRQFAQSRSVRLEEDCSWGCKAVREATCGLSWMRPSARRSSDHAGMRT